MRALWSIFRMIVADQRQAMLRGAVLSLTVLLAGAALLGLSGWFITAAAAAGLAGVGAVFDVFRPSAMVRFLALGRTAARYGERVLTHDATLRTLAALRVRLLGAYAAAPYDRLIRLRGAQVLNRITADVDALDGVSLRLVLPVGAGLAAQAVAFAALWWLVDLRVALWICGSFTIGAGLALILTVRAADAPSRRAERAAQAFRSRFVDLIRARTDLAIHGQLVVQQNAALAADQQRRLQSARLDRIERLAGLALNVVATLAAGGALWIGMTLAQAGSIGAPFAALGFFAALALAETIAPLRRTAADLGRMTEAAGRVKRDLHPLPQSAARISDEDFSTAETSTGLHVQALCYHRPGASLPVLDGIDLAVAPGEILAVTGQSGSGKSTLLLLLARLIAPDSGNIFVNKLALADWPESQLRANLMLVPQRAVLMAGTIHDNLALARPDLDHATAQAVLKAVALDQVIEARGGLNTRLGDGGSGLSGGEARRLVLARALLRNPAVLLLDEPTEGLDEATAKRVLTGIRAYLPDAAIITASHRPAETDWADRVLHLA